nr:serine/threonine protein kinase [Oceanusvirus sp.]
MSGVSKPHFFRAEQIIHHSQRSTIYRARDVCTGHPVVVKRSDRVVGEMSNILGAMRSGCQLTQRPYIREPFSAARLDGGSDRVGSGLMIALEEYEPVDEAEWTRERGDEETLELMRPFFRAVAELHVKTGMVHCDIKPANFVSDKTGNNKLLIDFELAVPDGRLLGKVLGTLAYVAPETMAVRQAKFPADSWALGVMLYQACTGRFHPYGQDVTAKDLREKAYRPEEMWPREDAPLCSAVCSRYLEKNPLSRPWPGEFETVIEWARSKFD